MQVFTSRRIVEISQGSAVESPAEKKLRVVSLVDKIFEEKRNMHIWTHQLEEPDKDSASLQVHSPWYPRKIMYGGHVCEPNNFSGPAYPLNFFAPYAIQTMDNEASRLIDCLNYIRRGQKPTYKLDPSQPACTAASLWLNGNQHQFSLSESTPFVRSLGL